MDGNNQTAAHARTDPSTDEKHQGTAVEHQAQSSVLFRQFSSGTETTSEVQSDISLVLDIPLQLSVELGRAKISIRNLLKLTLGSVVELDGAAGGPLKVFVNGCLIAQGEVVVVDGKFGIRLTEIIAPSDRIAKLNK
jgi:flagellar motor switch protein FliN/FliY